MAGIVAGTASIVSDNSFNPDSSLGSAGTSAVILAPSTNCTIKFYAKGNNWAAGLKIDQSAYHSELAGVIAALTMLDVLVRHHDLTSGAVAIALDGESVLIQSGGDWSLAWINLHSITSRLSGVESSYHHSSSTFVM